MSSSGARIVPNRSRWLIWMLRAIGLFDLIALFAVLSPRSWISASHQALGMGSFPHEPIAGYLARCTSIWYASYGILLWFISYDIRRYSPLITFLAGAMFVQGFVIISIDILEAMPQWWILLEGPCCSALGASLLLLQRATTGAGSSDQLSQPTVKK